MQIVHVVYEPLEPPLSGASLRDQAVNDALQQLGKTTTLSVRQHLPDNLDWYDRSVARTYLFIPDDVCARLTRSIAAMAPDLVVLSTVSLSSISKSLLAALDRRATRLVADNHNVESCLLAEIDRTRLPRLLRLLAPIIYAQRWRRARRVERTLAGQMSAIWVCSEGDRARFIDVAGNATPVHIVPNAVPKWCRTSAPSNSRFRQSFTTALFVGHLGYRPNEQAVNFLVDRIWPLIRKHRQDFKLVIAGRSPFQQLEEKLASCENISLIASPPDIRPIYAGADVALMPIFEGGGSRIKVLEALAIGIPVVATAKAVEGLAMVADQHYLRAESAAEFAAAIDRLAQDQHFRDCLIARGQEFASVHHGPEAIAKAIGHAINGSTSSPVRS